MDKQMYVVKFSNETLKVTLMDNKTKSILNFDNVSALLMYCKGKNIDIPLQNIITE